jgi:cytochrome c biogenesis protein CcdA
VLILVPIAFAAGVITAFTPCILPVLPIVLAGGAGAATKRRPYAIAVGLVTTFTAFLLAGAWLWSLIGVSPKHQIKIGAALLLVLAVILVVPKAGELVERPFAFLTRRRAGDLGGGFLLGASLGLVFIPCGGPVLATLTANAATNRVGGWIVVIAIAYALGAALPMLAIARGSRGLVSRFRQHAQAVRVTGGVLMAVAALVIYQGWAESLQTKVPGYANWVQSAIEGNSAAQNGLDRLVQMIEGKIENKDGKKLIMPRARLERSPATRFPTPVRSSTNLWCARRRRRHLCLTGWRAKKASTEGSRSRASTQIGPMIFSSVSPKRIRANRLMH